MAEPSQGFPVLRLLFHVAFLATLGSVYGYSAWSDKLLAAQPSWTQKELGLVFSLGIFGAFTTPVGGFLYDNAGAEMTYLVGCLLTLGGWASFLYAVEHQWSPLACGLLYYLEEQGSSTLYMGVALDTLVHFPGDSISFSMGMVALGYSMSSVILATFLKLVPLPLASCVRGISLLILACTVIRLALGPLSAARKDRDEPRPPLREVVTSAPFLSLLMLSMLCLAPCCGLLGFIRNYGDLSDVKGADLANAAFLINAVSRVGIGFLYDKHRRIPPSKVLLLIGASIGMCFCLLALLSFGTIRHTAAAVWVVTLGVVFLFGASAPITSVYIKDYFDPSECGMVLGLQQFSIAVANLAFNIYFAPVVTAHGNAGFVRTFAASAIGCGAWVAGQLPRISEDYRRKPKLGV